MSESYEPPPQHDYQVAQPYPQAQYQVAPQPQYVPQPYPQQNQPQQYQPQQYQVAPKSPAVSVLCSVFIPGLGSMVAGNAGIGALILVLYIVGIVLSAFLIGIPIAIGMWIWGLVNAHSSAVRWNRQHGIIS
jgi:TM2 domain-containing membrane protein YozV